MGTAKRILGIGDIQVDDSQEPILREDAVTFSFIVQLNTGFTIPESFKLEKNGAITGSKEMYLPFCFSFFLKKFLEYYQGLSLHVIPEQDHISIQIVGSSFGLEKIQNLDGFLNKSIGVLNVDLTKERYRAAQSLKKEVENLKADWILLQENLKTNPNNSIANQKVEIILSQLEYIARKLGIFKPSGSSSSITKHFFKKITNVLNGVKKPYERG